MKRAVLMLLWCVGMLAVAPALGAGEESGTVSGVLASKGETWIGVRPEGQDDSVLYVPQWKGGLPKDGGGFDKEMLATIKSTPLGATVKLEWKLVEEQPRVVALQVTAPPAKRHTLDWQSTLSGAGTAGADIKKGLDSAVGGATESAEPPVAAAAAVAAKPERSDIKISSDKSGSVTAIIEDKGDDHIVVRKSNKDLEKYFLRMVNGAPDPDMLLMLGKVTLKKDFIRFDFQQVEGKPRITKLTTFK